MKKISLVLVAFLVSLLSFGQTQRTVCFELFSGENCPPCVVICPEVYNLVNQNQGSVILVHYMLAAPSAGTLYYEDPGDANNRANLYGIQGTPEGVQDGWMWDSTANSFDPELWNQNYLNAEEAVTSPFSITVTDTFSSTADSFYATVTVTGAQNVNTGHTLKLQLALMENLQYEYPIGNNTETNFPNVVRKMYSLSGTSTIASSGGTTIPSTWTNGEVKTYNFSGVIPSYVRDKTQLTFAAFVQDLSTKFIAQTAQSNPFTFDVDIAAAGLSGNFGSCPSGQYTPQVNIANTGNQTLTSCYAYEYVDGNFIDSVYVNLNLPAGNSITESLTPLNLSVGTHTITVTLTSPNFTIDPNPANNTTYMVVDFAAQTAATPLVEGFENGDPTVNDGWGVENPDHDSTWRLVNTGHNSSNSEAVYYAAQLNDEFTNPVNNLYTPPLNLTYTAHATVKFDFADQFMDFGGGEYGGDSLDIDVSSNCGNTWTTVYGQAKQTAPIQTVTSSYTYFVPTNTQWGIDTADISVASNHDNVLLRFRSVSLSGNNFYLDNVNVYTYDSVPYTPPTGIVPVSGIQSLEVYPNPSNTQVNVVLSLDKDAEVSYQLSDVTGNMVANIPAETKMAGENTFSINTASLTNGIYFVTIVAGTNRVSKMIAVMH